MNLKPQSSPKELLEQQLEELRQSRSALSEEVISLLKSRNALQRDIQAEGDKAFAYLRKTEQECNAKKETLLNEVLSLEERRKVALMPFTERKKLLDAQEAAIVAREASLTVKEAEISSYQSLLADTKASLADRTAELDAREQEISRGERKITASLDFHAKSAQALADKWQVFREYEAQRTARLDAREKELDIQEVSIEKEKVFNENAKKELQAFRTDLDSRRLLLAQALKEQKAYARQHSS